MRGGTIKLLVQDDATARGSYDAVLNHSATLLARPTTTATVSTNYRLQLAVEGREFL